MIRRHLSWPTFPQPLVAVVLSAGAMAMWGIGLWRSSSISTLPTSHLLIAVILIALVIAAYHFPIHIDTHTKIEMFSVPVYMLVLLTTPIVAGVAAGLAFLGAEVSVRKKRGLFWTDIWAAVSRWVMIVVVGATISHMLFAVGAPLPVVLLGVAVALFVGDVCTFSLILVAVNHRRPLQMIPVLARQMWRVEAAQYLLGIVGVLLALYIPWACLLLALPIYLVHASFRGANELHESTHALLNHMADIVDQRDPSTHEHSRRVETLCGAVLAELAVGRNETELILAAARLHDLGKIAISDTILHKPGALTEAEWAVMMTHVEVGAKMVEDGLPSRRLGTRLAEIVRGHHEHWDGKGYPRGLVGAEIPLGGRVIAVADAFDAMTNDRSYRPKMSEMQALASLQQGRGKQWDAAVVDAFLRTRVDRVAPTEIQSGLSVPFLHSGKPAVTGE